MAKNPKGFRLDPGIRADFELWCEKRLKNEVEVIQSWMYWMMEIATDKQRKDATEKYLKWKKNRGDDGGSESSSYSDG